ncbi:MULTISPECIES: prephenate dehydrogenase [Methanosarcina]|uniref:Prephenate dehydrogenase n=6 Tax=Methanosarcina mazei TaxID=2209 RepID=A0A0F8MAK6_METMZ|nr:MULTISPECIES: prephenate dehydrogenase [Methanosarcina]AAM30971.1 Prephenate dehydrogenase [Methanosarcina mazei Go1]AKB60028.1 Prephenate and/or arogenate dehydrogenase (unknown specificity) [Methanosarcina mazei SarPi]AKB63237.1 Prephenate and/or arogenate dehydrogenase (unknown specificity) [Methanosarcina mazei S-6]AKB66588.1 Prephenate and/or arogenate dehydrogenase (unknown specificity) [Methanosarcina mazei LYC]AKB69931.1 Prephenate and/or arogenate dehydrogenase (unknown specificity
MNTDYDAGKTKVLILGGTGEMGQWFTRFFKERGYEVTVWGKGGKIEVAKKLDVPFALDLEAVIPESDIVIVSVPINATEETIAEIAPKMKAGSILMDFTSIKVGPVEAMRKFAPKDVEILGTHPMFGPTIPTIRGQTVILVPVKGYSEKWFPVIRQLFEESGAHVEITTAEEHDRLVSVVQGLTHFAYIAIGTTIDRLDFDVKKSRKFVSPVYSIMLDFVGRILGQNPYLYALIQMENPGVPEVHEAFIKECEELSSLVKAHDEEGFVRKMKAAARKYDDTSHALRRSDKLINSRIIEYETILNSTGKVCGFSHIYSGNIHVGRLEKVRPNEIVLMKLVSKGTAPNIKNRFITLKLENLRPLSEAELREWRKENLEHSVRDISVVIPEGADPEVVLRAVSTNKHLADCKISDIYKGVNGTLLEKKGSTAEKLGVTYRISIFGDCDADSVETEVTALLCGLGCRIREKNLKFS